MLLPQSYDDDVELNVLGCRVDILGTNCDGEPRTATSTLTLLLNSAHSFIIIYPTLLEGADSVGGQLRGDKRCPFSGVTSSGRVWRKVE